VPTTGPRSSLTSGSSSCPVVASHVRTTPCELSSLLVSATRISPDGEKPTPRAYARSSRDRHRSRPVVASHTRIPVPTAARRELPSGENASDQPAGRYATSRSLSVRRTSTRCSVVSPVDTPKRAPSGENTALVAPNIAPWGNPRPSPRSDARSSRPVAVSRSWYRNPAGRAGVTRRTWPVGEAATESAAWRGRSESGPCSPVSTMTAAGPLSSSVNRPRSVELSCPEDNVKRRDSRRGVGHLDHLQPRLIGSLPSSARNT